jgi:hypothetical protein
VRIAPTTSEVSCRNDAENSKYQGYPSQRYNTLAFSRVWQYNVFMTECCEAACCEPVVTNTPGPQGEAGANGADGTDGISAFALVANYTPNPQPVMPAEGGTVTVNTTTSTGFLAIGEIAYAQTWGYLLVVALPTDTSVTLQNLKDSVTGEYSSNAAPGTPLAASSKIVPGGLQGPVGATQPGALLAVNNLNDVNDAGTSRTNLGLGTMAVQNANAVSISGGLITGITDLAVADGGTGASNPTDARNNLGLNIGLNVMAWSFVGQELGALVPAGNDFIWYSGPFTPTMRTLTPFALTLLDDADAATMRATLGVTNTFDMLLFRHEASAGSDGGSFSPANAWITVPINTEIVDTGNHGSIAANQITLSAGTYRYRYGVVTYGLDDQFQARLYNVTDGAIVANSYGQVANSHLSNAPVVGVSNGSGRFTIAASKAIRLEAQSRSAKLSNGFGIAASLATDPSNEVYSWIEFIRE